MEKISVPKSLGPKASVVAVTLYHLPAASLKPSKITINLPKQIPILSRNTLIVDMVRIIFSYKFIELKEKTKDDKRSSNRGQFGKAGVQENVE